MGRPSVDALAMAGADWARYCVADDDGEEEEEDAPPPEHLRAFEAFLETVVPVDMALAFGREEAARARRGERRRGRREDVEEKLKLWAKAVARKAKAGVLGSPRVPHSHAREPVILASPGEANSLARGSKERGAQTSPGQARVGNNKLGVHPNPLLVPSPRAGRRGEPWQKNQPRPKQDIECIYGA